MLLERVRKGHRAILEVTQNPPAGIDGELLRATLLEDFIQPVQLATNDDFETIQRISLHLQQLGLAACIFDDSSVWIRLVEMVRARLGRGRKTAEAPPSTPTARPPPTPAVTQPLLHDTWLSGSARRAMLATVLLPLLLAVAATTLRDYGLVGEISALVGANSDRDDASLAHGVRASERVTETPSSAGLFTPVGATLAAIIALLTGLVAAAGAGEGIERVTRRRAPLTRLRLRHGTTLLTGIGVVHATFAVWMALATTPADSEPAPPVRLRVVPARLARGVRRARCQGGAFARFVCRSAPPERPFDAKPFSTLLANFRHQSQHDAASDAGTATDAGTSSVPVALPPVAIGASRDAGAVAPSRPRAERARVTVSAPRAPKIPPEWWMGWLFAGLMLGSMVMPGWRRMGRP